MKQEKADKLLITQIVREGLLGLTDAVTSIARLAWALTLGAQINAKDKDNNIPSNS